MKLQLITLASLAVYFIFTTSFVGVLSGVVPAP